MNATRIEPRPPVEPAENSAQTEAAWKERRNAVRHKANGSVTFRVSDESPAHFEGRLLDISSTGFRVRHEHAQLRSGQECDFTLPGSKGKARVVWNRITPEHIETGFLILNCDAG
jgi:hypothetical protein